MRIADKTELLVAWPLGLELSWHNGVLLGSRVRHARGLVPTGLTAAGRSLLAALERYVEGEAVRWPRVPMDMHGLPDFTRQVLLALRDQVPHGATTTYGELAALAGSPGAARAVGQIMARNPWPLLVPCHRVLGVGGALTGFSAEGGLDLKRLLLEIEGAALPVGSRD